MITQDTVAESFSLTPSTMMTFYILDLSDIITDIEEENKYLYFYNGLNNNFQDVVWQGKTYLGLPILGENFGYDSQKPVRPTIKLANIDGHLSNLIRSYGGIEGAFLTRKRTLIKYLDDVNFPDGSNPYGTADPNAGWGDDLFVVERKVESNSFILEYELSIPYDLDQTRYPTSQILSDYCRHEYRGEGCWYQGLVLTDSDGNFISQVSSARPWRPDVNYAVSGECVYLYDGIVLQHYQYKTSAISKNKPPKDNLGTYWQQINALVWRTGDYFASGEIAYTITDGGKRIYGVSQADHVATIPYSGFYNYSLWKHDNCGQALDDCRKRFYKILPFGGFRGTAALPL